MNPGDTGRTTASRSSSYAGSRSPLAPQQVEPGDPVVLPLPGSVPAGALLSRLIGDADSPRWWAHSSAGTAARSSVTCAARIGVDPAADGDATASTRRARDGRWAWFVRESERPVAHGGVTLEEVVVPFVEIERSGSTAVAASAGPEKAVAPSVEDRRK